jgi:hypothetical protein
MGSPHHFYPESGYLGPSFHHRRAMWATAVALACGILGGTIGLLVLITGRNLDDLPRQAIVDPGLAELWYDFAALQAAGTSGVSRPMAEARFVPVPEPANAGIAGAPPGVPAKRCAEATWPFFDNDCLWGQSAEGGRQDRHRKRIVARLKSPWCSGLRSKEGAYICRPRT